MKEELEKKLEELKRQETAIRDEMEPFREARDKADQAFTPYLNRWHTIYTQRQGLELLLKNL